MASTRRLATLILTPKPAKPSSPSPSASPTLVQNPPSTISSTLRVSCKQPSSFKERKLFAYATREQAPVQAAPSMTFRHPSSFFLRFASFSSALNRLELGGPLCFGSASAVDLSDSTRAASSGMRFSGRLYVQLYVGADSVGVAPASVVAASPFASFGAEPDAAGAPSAAAPTPRIDEIHLATYGLTSTLCALANLPKSPAATSSCSSSSPSAVMDLFNLERDRFPPATAAAPSPPLAREPFGAGLVDDEDEVRPTCLFSSRLIVSVFCRGRTVRTLSYDSGGRTRHPKTHLVFQLLVRLRLALAGLFSLELRKLGVRPRRWRHLGDV